MALAQTPPAQAAKLACLDLGWNLLRGLSFPQEMPELEVVIVGVDEASIEASGKPFALLQQEFSELLDGLRLGDARAVGLDVVLPRRSYANLVPGASLQLARALADLRDRVPVVIGAASERNGSGGDAEGLYAEIVQSDGLASLQVPLDQDGKLRRAPAAAGQTGNRLPPLARQLAAGLQRGVGEGLVDYALGKPFDYIPLAEVLAAQRRGEIQGLRARFKGRVVLVGAILPDQDRQVLPVRLANWEHGGTTAGVVFQAQLLRSLLAGRLVRPTAALEWLAAALAGLLAWRLRRRPLVMAPAGLLAALVAGVASTALLAGGVYASPLAAWLVLAVGVTWSWWRAYRAQRAGQRRTRAIFAGYVSPAILDTILSGDLLAGTSSSRQPLAFLFADLRGFTALCHQLSPEHVIAHLNRYYGAIVEPLHRYGGTIDKFSGDGIMVFFGAPAASANPCHDAVMAALGVLDALATLNAALLSEGQAPLKIGIGIAYGDAVLGNVGTPERHDYTATGAATALAAHIQQMCKATSYSMLIERGAFEHAGLSPSLAARFDTLERHLDKHGMVALAGYTPPQGQT